MVSVMPCTAKKHEANRPEVRLYCCCELTAMLLLLMLLLL